MLFTCHALVALSLNIMLLMNLYNTHSDAKVSDVVHPEDNEASRNIYERTVCNDISVDEITSCEVLNKICDRTRKPSNEAGIRRKAICYST